MVVPSWALTSMVITLDPTTRLTLRSLPLVTVLPFTVTVALFSRASGVTVTDFTELSTLAV